MQHLMDEEDATDGAGTGEDLLAALRGFYLDLTPESHMEHVSFRYLPA